MSDLKPCPICNREADSDGPRKSAKCSDDDCPAGRQWVCVEMWQGLPSPSEAAREIARNLRRFGGDQKNKWEFSDGTEADFHGWADRLESLPKVPPKVWAVIDNDTGVTVGTYASERVARGALIGPEDRRVERVEVVGAHRGAACTGSKPDGWDCDEWKRKFDVEQQAHRTTRYQRIPRLESERDAALQRAEQAEARVKELEESGAPKEGECFATAKNPCDALRSAHESTRAQKARAEKAEAENARLAERCKELEGDNMILRGCQKCGDGLATSRLCSICATTPPTAEQAEQHCSDCAHWIVGPVRGRCGEGSHESNPDDPALDCEDYKPEEERDDEETSGGNCEKDPGEDVGKGRWAGFQGGLLKRSRARGRRASGGPEKERGSTGRGTVDGCGQLGGQPPIALPDSLRRARERHEHHKRSNPHMQAGLAITLDYILDYLESERKERG